MALPDNVGLVAGTSRTTGIAAASCETANNYLGAEVDNATNLDDLGDFQVAWSYGSAPTASKTLKACILYAFDGSNYEEGAGDGSTDGSDVDPQALSQVLFSISPPADTSTHRAVFGSVPLLPYKFKVILCNVDTGQTVTATVTCKTRKAYQITD